MIKSVKNQKSYKWATLIKNMLIMNIVQKTNFEFCGSKKQKTNKNKK